MCLHPHDPNTATCPQCELRLKLQNSPRRIVATSFLNGMVVDPDWLAEQTDYDDTIASFETGTGRGI
jgi:hypothetical protein